MSDSPFDASAPSTIYASVDRVRAPSIRELCAYWRSKLRGRPMPAPSDLDPGEIRHLLPSLFIAEYVGDPMRVRYRLVGTQQVYYNGLDFTGLYLDEIDWGAENEFVKLVHDTLFKSAAPVVGCYQWGFRDSILGHAEFGAFPLSEDGVTVARSIGIDVFVPFNLQLSRSR